MTGRRETSLYGTTALRIQRSRQQAVQSHMSAYRNWYRSLTPVRKICFAGGTCGLATVIPST